ncbi:nitroreductase family protein [Methanosarcina horonobensis]|uniref:nitroreductase family protein n=1 Tax=Methanosarcina horonobensis TaxID=418008 RepID=UPI000A523638|nr:nitroreductase family protein [Methanosarcina horonobensis]
MDNIKATGEQISNAVLDNIYQRRSVRNYSDKEVPDEIIREIIRAGTYAPSAVNKQPWRFVVVKNRQLIDEYDDRARKVFLAAYGDTKKPGPGQICTAFIKTDNPDPLWGTCFHPGICVSRRYR